MILKARKQRTRYRICRIWGTEEGTTCGGGVGHRRGAEGTEHMEDLECVECRGHKNAENI